jgi:hypothetical protein
MTRNLLDSIFFIQPETFVELFDDPGLVIIVGLYLG